MRVPLARLLLCIGLAVTAALHIAVAAGTEGSRAPVILISLDAFRWDYTALHPAETPHLRQLAAEGVTADGLIPVFPSNTFPNHYTIATGLYPSHSGIVNNYMYDSALGESFTYTHTKSARDSRWWGGEPIWITAVKQGRRSACSFWPGSEAEIKGVHATFWKPYDYSIPYERRLDEMISWLKLPESERPAVVLFYLEEANGTGHKHGPDSPELVQTLQKLDGQIGAMEERLSREGVSANLVIVSDHGMTPCSARQVEFLDDYLDLKNVQVDFDETVCGLRPAPGADVVAMMAALSRMPHAKAYRATELPARWHIDATSARVPPIWVVPDEGWEVVRRDLFERVKAIFVKGQHGYDPAYRSMHGIFIANGPAFRRGVKIPEVENIHIYNLLCAAAGLQPAPNDGDDRLVKSVMRQE